jgi:DNA/RNA-binding protein KIN17
MKKERATTSDEQRERILIAEQIERAAAEAEKQPGPSRSSDSPPAEEGLKRDEGTEPVKLSFSMKPAAPATADSTPAASTSISTAPAPVQVGLKMNPLKPVANPLKAGNPLKRANPLKAGTSSSQAPSNEDSKKRSAPMTAAEQLILEDQQRKKRKMERDSLA